MRLTTPSYLAVSNNLPRMQTATANDLQVKSDSKGLKSSRPAENPVCDDGGS